MNCEETTGLLSDRLNGLIATEDERRLLDHLATCPACREEAAAVSELWTDMGAEDISVPHERMRARFHAALAAYDERSRSTTIDRISELVWPHRPAVQLAAAVALLAVGVMLGRTLPRPTDDEIAALRQDVGIMSLALLQHQSATERLRGVEWSQRMPGSSAATEALLEVVRNDRNENVRLAAVEALSEELHRPDVGAALTEAMSREQTPLVQLTLAQMLLRNEVSGSVAAVERLIAQDGVDASLQEYLRAVITETQEESPSGELL